MTRRQDPDPLLPEAPLEAERVRAAFDGLPQTHQQVLRLARSGHSYAEIAEQLGVAPAMVSRWALHAVLSLGRARLDVQPA